MVSDFPLEYVLSYPVKLVGLGCDAPPVNNLVDLVIPSILELSVCL